MKSHKAVPQRRPDPDLLTIFVCGYVIGWRDQIMAHPSLNQSIEMQALAEGSVVAA